MNNYGYQNNGRGSVPQQQATGRAIMAAPDINMTSMQAMQIGGVAIVPTSMKEIVEFANLMAGSGKMVRKHLRESPGACLGVAMQAFRWGMDPFMVASKSFEVNDQIAYEAQLIAAVIIRNAPVKGRPEYAYKGEGQQRRCTVTVITNDGQTLQYESPRVGDITPKNSPLWKTDTDQQLGYYSIRALARKHFPDVLMGAYDVDEADSMKDITPPTEQPAPVKRTATSALDALQSKRTTTIEADPAEPEFAPQEQNVDGMDGTEPELPPHDEDGVLTDADEPAPDDEIPPGLEVPDMPADLLNLWEGENRWGKPFGWISETAEKVTPEVLKVLAWRYSEILDRAASYNEAGALKVKAIREKAGP